MKKVLLAIGLVLSVFLLSNSCASGEKLMEQTKAAKPSDDTAIVNIFMPSKLGRGTRYNVFVDGKFAGRIETGFCLQMELTPGEHVFMVRGGNWTAVKGSIEAGKTYYLVTRVAMGVAKPTVNLDVVKPGDKELKGWLGHSRYYKVNPNMTEKFEEETGDPAQRAYENVLSGSSQSEVLLPEDGV